MLNNLLKKMNITTNEEVKTLEIKYKSIITTLQVSLTEKNKEIKQLKRQKPVDVNKLKEIFKRLDESFITDTVKAYNIYDVAKYWTSYILKTQKIMLKVNSYKEENTKSKRLLRQKETTIKNLEENITKQKNLINKLKDSNNNNHRLKRARDIKDDYYIKTINVFKTVHPGNNKSCIGIYTTNNDTCLLTANETSQLIQALKELQLIL